MKTILKKLFQEFIKTVGKTKFILFLFSAFFISVLTIIQPLFLAKIISFLEDFLKNGIFDTKNFYITIALRFVITIIYIFYSYIHRYYISDINSLKNHNRVFLDKINDIFSMSYKEYLGKKSGSIYKNFDRGIGTQFSFVFFFFKDFIGSIFSIFIAIFILLYLDIKMALISLSLLPLMLFFGFYFNKKTIKKQREINKQWDRIFGVVGDFLSNLLLSKTLFLEKTFENNLTNEIQDEIEKQKFVSKGWSILDVYTSALIYISRLIVMGIGTYFVINKQLEFYELFIFFHYIGFIYYPLSFVFGSFSRIQREVSEAERYYKEFENMELEDLDKGKKIKDINGDIEFKNVIFGYSKNKNILKDISFSIKKGEKIAFVGDTGAGKTTIINLILRLWDTSKGEILVDGENINGLSKKSLRQHIGIVTQDIGLYNDTLKNNLLYANKKATLKEMEKALKMAEANFVFELENKINTVIGERGLKLSGGEKQRVAIARLFLKDPKILILDEATSALDNKTEKLVHKALEKLMKGRTSIIIAHRLSTIKNVDKVFVLKNGKIVEEGTYNSLIRKKGEFYKLVNPESYKI